MNLKALSMVTATAFASITPANAESGSWEYGVSVYLFAAETSTGITTPNGSVETTLSFSDALDNLDFALMGAFEARNGRWGGLVDLMHFDLSFGTLTPGSAFLGATTDLEMNVVSVAGLYRVYEDTNWAVDLSAGFRWFDIDTAITLLPGASAGRTFGAATDWIDPVVGVRGRYQFSPQWSGTAVLDYGGFSSDSETYQVLLTADYALNDRWSLRGGYRLISFDHQDNGINLDIEQSGPIFGATYRF